MSRINPFNGPVVEGLEFQEVVIAKNQPEYEPLRSLVTPTGVVLTRWKLNEEQRDRISLGQDLYLEILTFGNPLQPLRLSVCDNTEAAELAVKIGAI